MTPLVAPGADAAPNNSQLVDDTKNSPTICFFVAVSGTHATDSRGRTVFFLGLLLT